MGFFFVIIIIVVLFARRRSASLGLQPRLGLWSLRTARDRILIVVVILLQQWARL